MPVALKSMLCLLNDAKSYASTEDNSLPTYIEVRFDKRNVFNHGSCIRIQYNTIQVYCVMLLASGVALHEMTHQVVYRFSILKNYQRVRKSRKTLKKIKKLSFRNRSKSIFFPGKIIKEKKSTLRQCGCN